MVTNDWCIMLIIFQGEYIELQFGAMLGISTMAGIHHYHYVIILPIQYTYFFFSKHFFFFFQLKKFGILLVSVQKTP